MTKEAEPYQQELPFTQVPNVVFDDLLLFLNLLELRLVLVIVRQSFGWRRERTNPMTLADLGEKTGFSRRSVATVINDLVSRGVIYRHRASRRSSYVYGLTLERKLRPPKEVPPPAQQIALQYNVHRLSDFGQFGVQPVENSASSATPLHHSVVQALCTTQDSEAVENSASSAAPLHHSVVQPLCTTQNSVLCCIKESGSKEINTHTHGDEFSLSKERSVENSAASPRVCASKFTKQQIREYAWSDYNETRKLQLEGYKVDGIRNPEGWAWSAYRSGEHDDVIEEWLKAKAQAANGE